MASATVIPASGCPFGDRHVARDVLTLVPILRTYRPLIAAVGPDGLATRRGCFMSRLHSRAKTFGDSTLRAPKSISTRVVIWELQQAAIMRLFSKTAKVNSPPRGQLSTTIRSF